MEQHLKEAAERVAAMSERQKVNGFLLMLQILMSRATLHPHFVSGGFEHTVHPETISDEGTVVESFLTYKIEIVFMRREDGPSQFRFKEGGVVTSPDQLALVCIPGLVAFLESHGVEAVDRAPGAGVQQ